MTSLPVLLSAWQPALVALVVALALARFGRSQPWVAAMAAGFGVLAGWWLLFGLPTASPRQLAERLPLLLAGALVLTGLATPIARSRPRLAPVMAMFGALGAGWWMAGAPLIPPDLMRALPIGLLTAALVWALLQRLDVALAPVAAGLLLAGLMMAGLKGPQTVMAMVVLAASLGSLASPARMPTLHGLPIAAVVAGLAVLPIIARGAATDWAVGLAPVLALWLGKALAARWPMRGGTALATLLLGAGMVVGAGVLL